jgi:hypothetical protein
MDQMTSSAIASAKLPAESAQPQSGGHNRLALALAIYQVLLGSVAAAGLILVISEWPILSDIATLYTTLRLLASMVTAAFLGAVLLNLVGLHIHAAVLKDFEVEFIGSYLLGPFAAGLLAIGLFAVLQGGLLVLGSGTQAPQTGTELRLVLFHAAVGLLTGLAFDTVVLKLDGIARELFGQNNSSVLSNALNQAAAKSGKKAPPAKE